MKVLIPGFIAILAGATIGIFAAMPPAATDVPAEAEEALGHAFTAVNVAVPRREGESTDGYVVATISGTHDDSLTEPAATVYVTAALGLLASTHQVQDLDPDILAHRDRLATRITSALKSMGQGEAIRSIEVRKMGFMARSQP
ncbi:hypothetical protein [Notoacmeibacter ruber]|uniref:Flagellar protein FliL n=1 Tax=Notoacmeibacter ruber TaxID=2670375 RepID=A0A3L7JEA9_9HYPH|nr:hypothetical protein [Notoacmeibacter ruber]RLQ88810.1 hypothetical protein D8780_11870 [Notoacmeibacter ruber]